MRHLRIAAVVVAVLAILLYVNIAQISDDSQTAFNAAGLLVPDIDQALVDRRHEAQANAWFEYSLLVAAGFSMLAVLAGPPVLRRLAAVQSKPGVD